jgi:hypothetical protein
MTRTPTLYTFGKKTRGDIAAFGLTTHDPQFNESFKRNSLEARSSFLETHLIYSRHRYSQSVFPFISVSEFRVLPWKSFEEQDR